MEPSLPSENGSAEVSDQDREQAEQAKRRGNDAFAGASIRLAPPLDDSCASRHVAGVSTAHCHYMQSC